MIRKVFSILGILLLSGFLINGISTTQHLKKLHAGVEDNLASIEKLNRVQAAVIKKNREMTGMLATVDTISDSLDETTKKTKQTLKLLSEVVAYNADTLALNDRMFEYSITTGENVGEVRQSLTELTPYMNELDAMLKKLDQTSSKDQKHLKEILKSTESLNRKTPGVSPR